MFCCGDGVDRSIKITIVVYNKIMATMFITGKFINSDGLININKYRAIKLLNLTWLLDDSLWQV